MTSDRDYESSDSRSPSKSRSAPVAIIIVVMLVVLPILYVLSVGPAVWMFHSGYIGDEVIDVVYFPVIALHDNSAIAGHVLEQYVEMFVPNRMRPPPPMVPTIPTPNAVPVPAPAAVPAPPGPPAAAEPQ